VIITGEPVFGSTSSVMKMVGDEEGHAGCCAVAAVAHTRISRLQKERCIVNSATLDRGEGGVYRAQELPKFGHTGGCGGFELLQRDACVPCRVFLPNRGGSARDIPRLNVLHSES
jgi:hypothetical protein